MKTSEKLLTLYGNSLEKRCLVMSNAIKSRMTNIYATYEIEGVLSNSTSGNYVIISSFIKPAQKNILDTHVGIFVTDGKSVIGKDCFTFSQWVECLEKYKNIQFNLIKILNGEEKECIHFRVVKV